MAKARTPSGGADFVAKIVTDPKNPPDTLLLQGYLGASSEDGYTRIYFDVNLASYAEIPNDAILHTVGPAEADSLAATNVWIKREAVLIYGPASSSRPKGTFLEGAIMQTFMPGTAAGPQAGGLVTLVGCPTHPRTVCCHLTVAAPQFAWPPSLFQTCPSHPWVACHHPTEAQRQAGFAPNIFSIPTRTADGSDPCFPSSTCPRAQAAVAWSIPTITFQGYPCYPSYGCPGGGHTLEMFAIPTITFQGYPCHTSTPGCHRGPQTM